MADIASMTTAMKARAKAAIDKDTDEGSPDYTSRTPRELRALILSQGRSTTIRAAMRTEGWFVAATETDAAGDLTFASASNAATDVS